MKLYSLLTLFFLCTYFLANGQKELYLEGLKYYENNDFNKALEYFYADKYAYANKDLLIRRVICNYELGKLDDAKIDISALLAFDVAPDELYLFIGKIFHAEGKYKKAIENYKIYLRRLSPKSENRNEIVHLIKQCGAATKLQYSEPIAFVDNFGPAINSKYDEFGMIQSPNFENKYYFTSAREGSTGGKRNEKGTLDELFGTYNSDMYTIEMIQGKWMEPFPLNSFLNTSRDEIAFDFSADGSILYYMKGPDYSQGTIYTDTFSADKVQKLMPDRFFAPINAENGDIYMNLFNDSTIVFASDRDGGYGGYDIYVTYRKGNYWSKALNLGPIINSQYDEVSPYLAKDGYSIFFSSNRVESIGGYDLFMSDFDVLKSTWRPAKNLGVPINSHNDDLYLYISEDGYTATLSSNRKNQGSGGFDLYIAYFKTQIQGQINPQEQLAFLSNQEFFADPKYALSVPPKSKNSKASTKSIEKETTKEISKKPAQPVSNQDTKNNNVAENTTKNTVIKEVEANIVSAEKKTEYIINPLYYISNEDIITATNRAELDNISSILHIYPTINVEIKAHTLEDGLETYALYFTIKRAEKIAEYLTNKGISSERITLKGYGSNYPVAKIESGGKKNTMASKINNRIEIKLKNTESLPINVNFNEPYLVDYLRDSRGELFKTIEDGLSYRVQIASVKQMYQNQVLLLYNDSLIERDFNNDNYLYTLGLYEKYEDAKLLVKDLSNYNITGAFIVPYINGERIAKNRIVDFAKYYPDLINYMQYND